MRAASSPPRRTAHCRRSKRSSLALDWNHVDYLSATVVDAGRCGARCVQSGHLHRRGPRPHCSRGQRRNTVFVRATTRLTVWTPGLGIRLCRRRYGRQPAIPGPGRDRRLGPQVPGAGSGNELTQPMCHARAGRRNRREGRGSPNGLRFAPDLTRLLLGQDTSLSESTAEICRVMISYTGPGEKWEPIKASELRDSRELTEVHRSVHASFSSPQSVPQNSPIVAGLGIATTCYGTVCRKGIRR
jgi:hypothetical protein